MARSVHLAQARVVLRMLLRLTDRGGWVAPVPCAYPRTGRALAALSGNGVRLPVNLHGCVSRTAEPKRSAADRTATSPTTTPLAA